VASLSSLPAFLPAHTTLAALPRPCALLTNAEVAGGVGSLRVWQGGYVITLRTALVVPPREALISLGRAAARRL
jgi:hypothetical protein